jgi:predicted DNA-binding protein (MmcQ/YjbR family)
VVHPDRYRDDDPLLGRLRTIALAYPGAEEHVSHGRPMFKAGKLFACWTGMSKDPDGGPMIQHPQAVLIKVDESDRLALEQDERTFLPAYFGAMGWLGLDLDTGAVGRARDERGRAATIGQGAVGRARDERGRAATMGQGAVDRIDWDEIAELVDQSYRLVARPTLLRRLDAEGPLRPSS